MFLISSFKSTSMQHDVYFVNCAPIYDKVDDNVANALGRGLSKYGHL